MLPNHHLYSNHQPAFCLGFACPGYFTRVRSCNVEPFVLVFFPGTPFQGSSTLQYVCRYFITFYSWVTSYWMDGPHAVYPSSPEGHSGCFLILTIVNSAVMNMCLHILGMCTWAFNFSYLGYMPRNRIAGSCDIFVLNFLRNVSIFYMSQKQYHCIPQITIKCNYWGIK